MSEVKITVLSSGPYLVAGAVELVDAQGSPVDTGGRDSIALCRCGASENRPFCDGSHKTCGFTD